MEYAENKKIALLIDAENISYRYASTIFEELESSWNITIRKLYGDFANGRLSPWNEYINKYALTPVQQFQNTSGKNSSDMALVIDAMDILYSDKIEGFCIVSSDSDFTRLVSRIRQSGKYVIGMGETKTASSLVNCCDRFQYLNVLNEDNQTEIGDKSTITPIEEIKAEIVEYLESKDNKTAYVNIGEIKQFLQKKHPDFDARNYGCAKFSTFIKKFSDVLNLNNKNSEAVLKTSDIRIEIEEYIKQLVRTNENTTIGYINQLLLKKYPKFNPKDFGYKQVKLFFTSIEDIQLYKKDSLKLKTKKASNKASKKNFSNMSANEIKTVLYDVDLTKDDIVKIKQLVEKYKTKSAINNNLIKAFPSEKNEKATQIYQSIKPFLKDKK